MSKHKHHIIPAYRCKELWPEIYLGEEPGYKVDGIEFYFKENIVEVPQIDHARIHWGYWCDDLEPLFEYITPAQWIIDLIPRDDYRDSYAAIPNAIGAIDGIEPARGNEHPDYKPVLDLDGNEIEGSEDWSAGKRHYYRRCIKEGIQPKTHEERAIYREEKEISYKREVEERKEIRKNILTKNQLIAKEKAIKVKSVYSLKYYHKQKEKGIDPNKTYRESHREENKDYAKWYYHNVQKPKNAEKKTQE